VPTKVPVPFVLTSLLSLLQESPPTLSNKRVHSVGVGTVARMIPDIPVECIENIGERVFYSAASELPEDYTVLYSYKFAVGERDKDTVMREADFVIVHPELGYAVVEVKQNPIGFHNGQWHEHKRGASYPLHKDPVQQANNAMFAILQRYKDIARTTTFPLRLRYALCFPETRHYTGTIPAQLKIESVWTSTSLDNLEGAVLALFGGKQKPQREACNVLVNKVLAPSFKLYSTLEEQLALFNSSAAKLLTEEQERILDETEEDKRKIFFGAAGTGKSFVAIEKARRLAHDGKKVFLTCYNKALVGMYSEHIPSSRVTSSCFLGHIQDLLGVPAPADDGETFYKETLPSLAFDHYSQLPDQDKYDAIIVDEGQDFRAAWFVALEAMVKPHGYFYVFADPKQDLFGHGLDTLKNMEVSKHRLTLNLRNSAPICELLAKFTGERVKAKLNCGLPVITFAWTDAQAERWQIEKEIGRLVSQGLSPQRILILSPHRQENSSLAGLTKIKEWPLVDVFDNRHGVKFSTIRSFKGLEADVVFLIGLKDSKVCTPADIYVGASRAKFLLYIFHQAGYGLS